MKRLDTKLKLSVSLFALMSGGALLASSAAAETISGDHDAVVVSTDVDSLTADDTAVISPGGLTVSGDVAGDFINQGSIEFNDSPIAGENTSLTADAIAANVQGVVGGDVSNVGSLSASANAGVSLLGNQSGADPIVFDAMPSVTASASGAYFHEVVGDVANSGTIASSATSNASADTTVASDAAGTMTGGAISSAFSRGALIYMDGGAFTNDADAETTTDQEASADDPAGITSSATSTGTISADVSGTSANAFSAGDVIDSHATAWGVDVYGAGSASNTGEITSDAQSDLTLNATATASNGDATVNLPSNGGEDSGYVHSGAYASGLYVANTGEDGVSSIDNSGTISATSNSTADLTVDATATGGSASIVAPDVYADSWAGGIGVGGYNEQGVDPNTTSVATLNNSGSVTADTATTLTQTYTATGEDDASVAMGGSATATATGVYADHVTTKLSNSGSISATATTNRADTATAEMTNSAATDSGAFVDGQDYTGAEAVGIWGDAVDGAFLNAEGGEIVADSSATATHDLTATSATDAGVSTNNIVYSLAGGVLLNDGEATVANDGSITATAAASNTINASATSTGTGENAGTATTSQSSLTAAAAGGLLDLGVADGFTNSGDIGATATADSTVTLAGGTGATSNNTLVAAAGGALFLQPVKGDVDNSGSITANATGSLDVGVASGTEAAPGPASSTNIGGAIAVGFAANISSPDVQTPTAEDATPPAPYTFTNSGDINATADMTVNVGLPTSTDPAPQQTTYAGVGVAGAVLWGDVNSVTNSGTITADGTFNASGVSGENSATGAVAVGLWMMDAGDNTVIDNSGDITASLSGNAQYSAAVGLMLGPVPSDVLAGVLDQININTSDIGGIFALSSDLVSQAAGVITVNNTGTISGTNDMEGGYGYGIFAETAPVPVVINQMGGSISGTTAAIAMNQGNADTLNWSGGEIHGLVDADSSDVVNVIQNGENDTTVTAGTDFTLNGAGQLNVGGENHPVTFVMNGLVSNTGEANVNPDATLVVGPTGEIDVGTYNQAAGSNLVIQFDPDNAGLITTTGDANIAGTFQPQALPGLYGASGSHTVIDAGGVINGSFDEINTTGDTLLLDFSTEVNDSSVVVSWNRNAFDSVDGLSDNAKSVGGALEAGYDPGRTPSGNAIELNDQLAGLFTLTDASQYNSILNSWSGSEHAQVMRAAANLSEPYLMALSEHLNDNRNTGTVEQPVVMLQPKGSSASIAPASAAGQSGAEQSGLAFWARAMGNWTKVNGDANADGYNGDTYGAVLGMDFRASPNILLGIAGSYLDDSIDFKDGDTAGIHRWSIGAYGSAQFDQVYLDGSFTYGKDHYKVDRTIITGGTGDLSYSGLEGVSSKYSGDVWMAHAEVGYNWELGDNAKLQPFAGLNYTSVDTGGFTETGGGDLALIGTDGTGKSFQSRVGARLSGQWGSGDVTWIPELRAEWRHEFKDNPAWIQASLVGLPNQSFTTVGSQVSKDLAVIGAGITAQFKGGWGLYFDYQGAFASGYTSHTAQGGVRVKF
ncbi:MAG: autotransporter domain-containing protein [Alphaproteobacteria bacterium]|nr:autotransporter domain-containing protein [Alphaproteobacteria bacterium]